MYLSLFVFLDLSTYLSLVIGTAWEREGVKDRLLQTFTPSLSHAVPMTFSSLPLRHDLSHSERAFPLSASHCSSGAGAGLSTPDTHTMSPLSLQGGRGPLD